MDRENLQQLIFKDNLSGVLKLLLARK